MRWIKSLGLALAAVAAISAPLVSVDAAVRPSGSTFAPKKRASVSIGKKVQPRSDILSVAASTSSTSLAARGGAAASDTSTQLISAAYFLAMDKGLLKLFRAKGVAFPSQLAGCIILFAVMVIADVVSPGAGDSLFALLSPGANLLAKWLAVFFVPGLAMLPLAPSMGSPVEIVKVLGVVVLGFYFTLCSTTYTVLGLRKLQGAVTDAAPVKKVAPSGSAPKAFSDEMLAFLVKGTVVSAAVSIAATRSNNAYRTPLQTIFLGFTTVASFVWGARFPPGVTKFLHPILTSTGLTFVALHLTGMATGSTFINILKEYKCGSLAPLEAGAGDLILSLLGPAVISFAIAMYSRKGVMASNLPTVLTGVAMGSAGSLFGTAAFVRAIGLGGSDGCFLRLSTIPRNVTTALAMVIAKMLGGDISIAASLVVLTGMFAAMIGGKTLDAWGVTDPVSRGLGLGAAGQSLGAASLSHEKDAFPFAAVNMVLVAVFATILASIPAIGDLLIQVACGAPTEEVISTVA